MGNKTFDDFAPNVHSFQEVRRALQKLAWRLSVVERYLIPIGTIISYGGTDTPEGFLECEGQTLSRRSYPELFAAIGTMFGSGDGATTFGMPDLRGRTIVGEGVGEGLTARPMGSAPGHELAVAISVSQGVGT